MGQDEKDGRRAAAPFVLEGEIDVANAPQMGARLDRYCLEHQGDVVVDCSRLTSIDSVGLITLFLVQKRLVEAGRTLCLTNVISPGVREVLEIPGVQGLVVD